MIKIEKGVPLPAKGGLLEVLPFDNMKVNDSFAMPVKDSGYKSMETLGARLRTSCNAHKKFKFTVRRIDNAHFRVWRIK